jgi:hypothetical protein
MSKASADRLYQLLPSLYRQKDQAQGEPLRALMAVLESQLQTLEGDMEALYDNWFIETCEPWAVPYIGDVLGVSGLSDTQNVITSQRIRVANTIRYRRRKGITAILERVLQESTGWYAHGVPYFALLSMTQHVQHLRPGQGSTADVRQPTALAALGGPFERLAHTADVRHIAAPSRSDTLAPVASPGSQQGKFNLPHMGIFLWRLQPYTLTNAAAAVGTLPAGARGYTVHPFGLDTPLFNLPQQAALTEATTAIHVPHPLTIVDLATDLAHTQQQYYGPSVSLAFADGTAGVQPVSASEVASLDLHDWEKPERQLNWSHASLQGKNVALDVTRGRLLVNPQAPSVAGATPLVTYTYGFSAPLGSGPYARPLPSTTLGEVWKATVDGALTADDPCERQYQSLAAALQAWENAHELRGVVRLLGSSPHDLTAQGVTISLPEHGALIIEAPNSARACLRGNLMVQKRKRSALVFNAGLSPAEPVPERSLTLSGLLIAGQLIIQDDVHVALTHTTLIPDEKCDSIVWAPQGDDHGLNLEVLVTDSIVGWVNLPADTRTFRVTDSLIAGCAGIPVTERAQLTAGKAAYGPPTTFTNTTVLGPVYVREIPQAVNVIFREAVTTQRRQVGSIRFSYVPHASTEQTPRLFRCQPVLALEGLGHDDPAAWQRTLARLQPVFTSTDYGHPGYGQLSLWCPSEIRQGGEGDTEMGAFHQLHQPQRQHNVRAALDEYLGVDFEAGVFYVT